MKSDFHIHTYYSDGVYSPEKIVDTAIEVGLQVIALTDHDNVLSYKVASDYIKQNNKQLELIKGVEINTLYKNYEVHILGYMMDTEDSDFKGLLKTQQNARIAGIGHATGSIEVGKSADFIVVEKNPLDDLKALRDVKLVAIRGHIIDHPEIKRCEKVENALNLL